MPTVMSLRGARQMAITLLALAGLAACTDTSDVVAPLAKAPQPAGIYVPAADTYQQMTLGHLQTCALRADGAMQCWGITNANGSAPALQFAGIGYYTKLGAGMSHTCAVRIDGAIECFGDKNLFGESDPLYLPQSGSFVDVTGGRYNTCGLRDDGVVECFGEGTASPQRVVTADVGSFTQLGGGAQHGCALRNDGVVQCWGGYAPALEAPHTRAATTGYFTQVSGGSLFTCALRNDGAVECWGYGFDDGQDPPLKQAATGRFTFVEAAYNHACAIRDDGKIECWGDNTYLQAPALKVASNGGRFIDVEGNGTQTCAMRDDHTIQCWGLNLDNLPGTAVLPTATFNAPASVVVKANIPVAFTNAQVPGYPASTSFTYSFDCLGNGHFSAWSSSNTFSCPTSFTGTKNVYGRVRDEDGDFANYSLQVQVRDIPASTADLRTSISLSTLSPDLRKPLTVKLNAALDAIAKGNTALACASLQDFINQVKAQRGKAIPVATADLWIQQATDLRTSLGC